MNQVVVDASVAAKWVVEEAHSPKAVLLLRYQTLHAPAHWRAEAVNVLWAKVFRGDLTATDAAERIQTLMRAPVVDTPISDLVPRAFAISVSYSITIYDSLYVALAEHRNIPLLTADQKLVRRLSGDAILGKQILWLGDLVPG